MMRKFVHKTLGYIYERNGKFYDPSVGQGHEGPSILPEFIENSQDREEVVEKDWIRMVFDEVHPITKGGEEAECFRTRRQAIEKHCPPLQKNFTEKKVEEYYGERARRQTIDIVCRFLKEHGLLEE